jgi:CrcB protein
MPEAFVENLPADSDIDLHIPAQRAEFMRAPRSVLAAISVGGAVGAIARWSIATALPASPDGFPWATFVINISGCLFIGVLMVLVTDVWTEHKLVRPFLGVGVLGGYTTFSTYTVDIQRLLNGNAAGIALVYLVATIIGALCAATTGIVVTRLALRTYRAEMEISR